MSDIVKSIVKYDGLKGLYRGLGPTVLGYLPTWTIYFTVYDGLKTTSEPSQLYKGHPWSLHIGSAMAAGAMSTVCTNPLWVIKTRFMVSHTYTY
jgi:solute carrier family 25 folate transporter 32